MLSLELSHVCNMTIEAGDRRQELGHRRQELGHRGQKAEGRTETGWSSLL